MSILVERTFVIERGSLPEFERLSREAIWPYMEARGCRILGLYSILHGGSSEEVVLLTAYDSMAHWESTRPRVAPPGDNPELQALQRKAAEAVAARHRLTKASHTRVLSPVTDWFDPGVRAG